MSSVQAVTALTISGSITFGMVLALLGHLKMTLARRPEQSTKRVDLLLSLLNLALIPLMIAAGMLVDFWGVRPAIILGSILLALSFLVLSSGMAYRRTLIAVGVAAFGASAVGASSLVLMPRGLFGVDERAASLQLGLVLVSLGVLIMPPLVDLLVSGLGFGRTMAIVAFLCLAPACLAALPGDAFPVAADPLGAAGALQNPGVWLGGLVFFFYAPLEAFVSVWITTYLTNNRQPETASASPGNMQVRWLAGFWSAFLISRLLFAIVEHAGFLRDTWSAWFLVLSALLSVATLGNLAGALRPNHAARALMFLGFFLGPVFPLLLGLLFRLDEASQLPGTSFGLLYACGSVGSFALAPLVGFSARARKTQTALLIPLLLALIVTAATILFVLVGPMFVNQAS